MIVRILEYLSTRGFFPPLIRELTASYHSVSADLEEFPAVAHRGYGRRDNTPERGMVGFESNPRPLLGWASSDGKGFLAWEQDGQLAVETIWWNDGCLGNPLPFYGKEEVAEGWLVVATNNALQQIAANIGPLKRIGALTREICLLTTAC